VILFRLPVLLSLLRPFNFIFILTLESPSDPSSQSPGDELFPEKKKKKNSGNSRRDGNLIKGSLSNLPSGPAPLLLPAPRRFFWTGSSSSSPLLRRLRVFFFFLSSSSSSSNSTPSSSMAFSHSFSVKLSV
ncbi:GSCOCG00004543001-RA-CDS, partial [Cotesia congregata]